MAQPSARPLAGLQSAGSGRLRFWGFEVYDLELNYLRPFSAAEIAKVSLEQIQRVGNVDAVQARPAGEIADPEFARLFFGIWLDARTSEPGLRQTLLAGTPP